MTVPRYDVIAIGGQVGISQPQPDLPEKKVAIFS